MMQIPYEAFCEPDSLRHTWTAYVRLPDGTQILKTVSRKSAHDALRNLQVSIARWLRDTRGT